MRVCIECMELHVLLVPLANKGPAWSPHRIVGSDIHV